MAVAGVRLFLSWLMFCGFRQWLTTIAFLLVCDFRLFAKIRFGFFNRRLTRMNADVYRVFVKVDWN